MNRDESNFINNFIPDKGLCVKPSPGLMRQVSPGDPASPKSPGSPSGKATSNGRPASPKKNGVRLSTGEMEIDWASLPSSWPTAGETASQAGTNAEEHKVNWVKRVVYSTRFEFIMGLCIIGNLLTMFINLQYREAHTGHLLGLSAYQDNSGWLVAKLNFERVEYVFCAIFVVEQVMRLYANRLAYLKEAMNILDLVIVVVTSLETFLLPLIGLDGEMANMSLIRIVRVARIARVAKVIRFAQGLSDLRVLIKTITASMPALVTSMGLVACIIMAGGVLMVQLLTSFMENEDNSYSVRLWAFNNYGSAVKATYTLFEATFTTGWPKESRKMIEQVDGWLAIFWVLWTVAINFAVMRVIGALFLKQTMNVASDDADRMAVQKMKEKEKFAELIRSIFQKGDESGDGEISAEEFVAMIYDPEVADIFTQLDLELFEVVMLFRLLSNEDGGADYEEFLQGAMKLKNSARTIDVIQILHEVSRVQKRVDAVLSVVLGEEAIA